MPWVHFTANFDWSPPEFNGHVTTAYKAGAVTMVTTPCAIAALAAGKGEKATKPRKAKDEASHAGSD